MGEIEPSNMRISDPEREEAVRMLGEHLSVGRLDVDEYGDRTARATAAKTRGELTELFTDLPDPRPAFGPVSAPAPAGRSPAKQVSKADRPNPQHAWGALVPLSAIAAVILYFTVFSEWYIWLLPAVVAVIGGAIWGGDDRRHDNRGHRRMHGGQRQLRRGWHD